MLAARRRQRRSTPRPWLADRRRRAPARRCGAVCLDAAAGRRAAHAENAVGRGERAARGRRARFARNCGRPWSTRRAISAAWPKSSVPRSWSIEVERGRARAPARGGDRDDRLLHSRRALFPGFDAADDGDSRASGRRAAHRGGLPAAQCRVAGCGGDAGAGRDRCISAARRPSPRLPTGRARSRAWTRSLVRGIAT